MYTTTKGARTLDHAIKSRALCRLSYSGSSHIRAIRLYLQYFPSFLKGQKKQVVAKDCSDTPVTLYEHYEFKGSSGI